MHLTGGSGVPPAGGKEQWAEGQHGYLERWGAPEQKHGARKAGELRARLAGRLGNMTLGTPWADTGRVAEGERKQGGWTGWG